MNQSVKLKESNRKYVQVGLIALLLMGSSGGLNMSTMGIFLAPLADSLNSSISSLSFFMTLFTLGTGIASFFVPVLLDRFSYRQIITSSTIITALATAAMAWTNSLLLIYVLGFIRGFASGFFGPMAVQLLINNWFFAKHGIITSIIFAGSGLFGAIFSPILSLFIDQLNVQAGLYLLASLILLLNAPGILSKYHFKPEDDDLHPYGSSSHLINQHTEEEGHLKEHYQANLGYGTFLVILSIGLLGSAASGLVQHLSSLTVNFNFSPELGGFIISAASLANILSKLIVGALTDRKGARFALSTLSLSVILGILLLLWHPNSGILLLGAFTFGFIYGIVGVGISLLAKETYNSENFAKVYPILSFSGIANSAIFMSVFGYTFDTSGSYFLALWICLIMMLINLFLLISLKKPAILYK